MLYTGYIFALELESLKRRTRDISLVAIVHYSAVPKQSFIKVLHILYFKANILNQIMFAEGQGKNTCNS